MDVVVRQIGRRYKSEILALTSEVNCGLSHVELNNRLEDMLSCPSYICFGLLCSDELVGISNGWLTTRFYCGRQLELDNVIVASEYRGKGYGKILLAEIESWARANRCRTVELNTYVTNSGSHKFYFDQGYRILGFHFQKVLTETT